MSMRDADGTAIGWGVAAGAYPIAIAAAVATVRLNADASAEVAVGGHEMGQGIRTAVALIVAGELGLSPDAIRITMGDTIAPPQHLTAGSWGTASAGPPVLDAARKVRAQLLELASALPDSPFRAVSAAELTLENGRLRARDGRSMGVAELFARAGRSHLDGQGQGYAPGANPDAIAQASRGVLAIRGPEFPDFVAFSYVAHFAEVRIDPQLPRPRISRLVTVVDCGKVISLRTARSQVYGALVWAVGAALSEESEVDPRFGGFLNANIAEYQIPVNADIGALEVDFIDEPDTQVNALGAKGLGEIASVGAAAAVANAVHHATGRRIRDLPIRIEKLL